MTDKKIAKPRTGVDRHVDHIWVPTEFAVYLTRFMYAANSALPPNRAFWAPLLHEAAAWVLASGARDAVSIEQAILQYLRHGRPTALLEFLEAEGTA